MTEQESGKRELSMASKAAKTTETPNKAELAAAELVAERLPDEVDATVEVNADPVAEVVETVEATHSLVGFGELLEDGRVRIDVIDDQILELLELRMEIAGGLLSAKHERGMNLRDKVRQGEILDRLNGATQTLNKHQVRELFELFIRLGVENFRQNIIDGRRGR